MEEQMDKKSKLGKKISVMAKAFGPVLEDGRNKFSKYDFTSNRKMSGIMRDHLSTYGLSIIPEIEDYSESTIVFKDATGKEKAWIRTVVKMNFEIIDVENNYSMTKKFIGADQDTGGKSFGQAVTDCCKRFYFKLFHVSSEDEPDNKTTETPPQQEGIIQRDLTQREVREKWNGKIYKGGAVKIDNVDIYPSEEQLKRLKALPKYN